MYRLFLRTTLNSVTQREGEAKETWQAMDQQKQEEFQNGPLADWGFEGAGLVKNSKKLIKVFLEKSISSSYWADRTITVWSI